ncbi:preprotein translocase subunit SecA [Desulfococcus sp.]|uniref:preprotein translocase subunit SecA n=1 Tax=Desulfococcus sp. TaxID=2025834 RepID=UPI00359413A2
MIFDFLTKVFGSKNDREIKKIQPVVEQINAIEPAVRAMSDEELKGQTAGFKARFEQGETIDDLLPEAFATVREASVRTLRMRHFDVQLIGGVVLHQGKISEMKTGEGKTLVSTLPAYLNSLTGKGVHIVTVNDYLARRDAEWMGQIYHFLGLTVGTIVHGMTDRERQVAYGSDITYGTNNEFGFDYLRDNMKYEQEAMVQGDLHFAIVDEVDSILIDEARTPLIISGPAEKSTHLYFQVNEIIPRLKREVDYTIDEKARTSVLTEEGVAKAESMLRVDNIYDPANIEMLHHVNQALKAHTLFKRDVDYIVKDGEVLIVDEFTGRLMPGRRYSEGLHQALEAKESVKIENENQTLATITFQNYFRMYTKLSGMTGTADTEAAEFKKIYNLDVMVIPTHMPMVRKDYPDAIYKTRREKFDAVILEIQELYKKGQPVLVGTISIDISEELSEKLKKKGVKHTVLNAKHHAKEAEIVAMAGQPGAVTISTNMAGRGTDIVLGEGVKDLGGLHIIGTERHESRRIDNQLRGRSGRQGDPGSSRFYLSLEDDLLRIFGGERITTVMDKLGMEEGEPIEHNLISRAIENAQAKVEARNFDMRKHLLEYDDVMNQQRNLIYEQRRKVLNGSDLHDTYRRMVLDLCDEIVRGFCQNEVPSSDWDAAAMAGTLRDVLGELPSIKGLSLRLRQGTTVEALIDSLANEALDRYEGRETDLGAELIREAERLVMLRVVDEKWMDHIDMMDDLRDSIGMRGYAQHNPVIEYKREGFELFDSMNRAIRQDAVRLMMRASFSSDKPIQRKSAVRDVSEGFGSTGYDGSQQAPAAAVAESPRQQSKTAGDQVNHTPVKRSTIKVGRNDPCPCGSGKKYKNCCGRNEQG